MIGKYLDISTAHTTKELRAFLKKAALFNLLHDLQNEDLRRHYGLQFIAGTASADVNDPAYSVICMAHSYGWWVFVHELDIEGAPSVLTEIWKFAEAKGCTWIKFDADAPYAKGLPMFDYATDAPVTPDQYDESTEG